MPSTSAFFVRVPLAWLTATALAYLFGPALIRVCVPAFDFIVGIVQSDFLPSLDIVGAKDGSQMRMAAILLHDVPIRDRQLLEVGSHVDYITSDVAHLVVPVSLLLAVLLSWPAHSHREWVGRLILGWLAMCGTLVCIVPLTLVGRFRMWLAEATLGSASPVPIDWSVHWVLFSEGGGRWLLPLVAGFSCVVLSRGGSSPNSRP